MCLPTKKRPIGLDNVHYTLLLQKMTSLYKWSNNNWSDRFETHFLILLNQWQSQSFSYIFLCLCLFDWCVYGRFCSNNDCLAPKTVRTAAERPLSMQDCCTQQEVLLPRSPLKNRHTSIYSSLVVSLQQCWCHVSPRKQFWICYFFFFLVLSWFVLRVLTKKHIVIFFFVTCMILIFLLLICICCGF